MERSRLRKQKRTGRIKPIRLIIGIFVSRVVGAHWFESKEKDKIIMSSSMKYLDSAGSRRHVHRAEDEESEIKGIGPRDSPCFDFSDSCHSDCDIAIQKVAEAT